MLKKLKFFIASKMKTKNSKIGEQFSKPYFDSNYYFQHNLDIFVSGLDPFEHFENHGQFESRDPSRTVSSEWLQYKYGNLSSNPYKLIKESIGTGKELSPNPLFDASIYVKAIGGLEYLNGSTAYDHYLNVGIHQNIKPNLWLDLESFAESNPWFFKDAKSNFEKFVNLFEIVRRNEIFNKYLCFEIENSKGQKIQLTSDLFNSYLQKIDKFPKNSDRFVASGWEIIQIIDELAQNDFSEFDLLSLVTEYPPKQIEVLTSLEKTSDLKLVSFCHWSSNAKVADWIEISLKTYRNLGFKVAFNTNLNIDLLPDFVKDNCELIIQRSNSGHDFESHKLTFDWLKENNFVLSQLVLTNDSHFFPVGDTQKLKNELANPRSPFWGLTENLWGKAHLQSYFLVVDKDFIKKYFDFVQKLLSNWKYISKTGLINRIELASHDFASENGIKTFSFFCGVDPTFDSWDKLPNFGVPILKIHLVRKLLTTNPGDTPILEMKLNQAFKQSQIAVSDILKHSRQMEVSS